MVVVNIMMNLSMVLIFSRWKNNKNETVFFAEYYTWIRRDKYDEHLNKKFVILIDDNNIEIIFGLQLVAKIHWCE